MKQLIFFPLLFTGILPAAEPIVKSNPSASVHLPVDHHDQGFNIQAPASEGNTKMRSAVFKAQEYCRAELKDFDFDIQYKVVSAVVYFSGTNFQNIAKGKITGNSLKNIKPLMEKCAPGTFVIFDEVKVMGPDNIIRTIPGISLVLN
jgi:GldM C-terminal domain